VLARRGTFFGPTHNTSSITKYLWLLLFSLILFKIKFIIIVYFNYNMIYYIIKFKYIFDFL
jgi:hypothetical protein